MDGGRPDLLYKVSAKCAVEASVKTESDAGTVSTLARLLWVKACAQSFSCPAPKTAWRPQLQAFSHLLLPFALRTLERVVSPGR